MQAVNLIFVFSFLLSLSAAFIQGVEVQAEIQSEVKNEVQGKVEGEVQSEILSDVPGVVESDTPAVVQSDEPAVVQSDTPIGILGSCSNPESYSGQSLCYPAGQYCGECVSFVKVCTKDYRTTSSWVRGKQVRGASISRGTAIATFPNGKYSGHAAIYLSQNSDGIQVWDQWVGHPVSQRTIRWNGSGISNNGDSFYVIN